ncbi:unnamed protein product [Lactuca virosa]|uniref:Uncharacterized protein n=1 Tax=Lactuca virosa TaxID=75947 RepID=A0AAU9PQG0_9ASTR|nr:unnamed protein product [Lactuca virosa]
MNHVDVLTTAYHFIYKRSNGVLVDRSFTATKNILKDYIIEFRRIEFEFHYVFKTGQTPQSPNTSLEGIEAMSIGSKNDLALGYVYRPKGSSKKKFFR